MLGTVFGRLNASADIPRPMAAAMTAARRNPVSRETIVPAAMIMLEPSSPPCRTGPSPSASGTSAAASAGRPSPSGLPAPGSEWLIG